MNCAKFNFKLYISEILVDFAQIIDIFKIVRIVKKKIVISILKKARTSQSWLVPSLKPTLSLLLTAVATKDKELSAVLPVLPWVSAAVSRSRHCYSTDTLVALF